MKIETKFDAGDKVTVIEHGAPVNTEVIGITYSKVIEQDKPREHITYMCANNINISYTENDLKPVQTIAASEKDNKLKA